ncbi:putative baseplate assembly protein [Nocardia sp. CDC159]|uniref:Baseplate assembly protein n=1 Tax=Nocardia pulmonis TaxID=2951408 RepID=A0A9X2EA87_9NOCA|nr:MULTISPECIES: putative baseplate assembly protein [Nocardia]MCM6776629.1 putative baseplate assembly protein [Nocardia pulmonis]MCM6789222.1 putative baseplate assembly protein [Nocardia sp. CDC159]
MSCAGDCDCCVGVRARTPAGSYNRPGLPALSYRVGTYGSFRETLLARLATRPELARLTTREADDPAIALLDCFAVLGDVLTFYSERIANEGYLRTATEPYSLARLGRLVGYRPRPALGASTYLAFTLDPGAATVIPAGSGARSIAKQNELPQTFETVEDLSARAEWNTLTPARTRPVDIAYYAPADPASGRADDVRTKPSVIIAGTTAHLEAGDRLLFLFGGKPDTAVRVVQRSEPDFPADRTVVTLVSPDDAREAAIAALHAAVTAAREAVPMARSAADIDERYLKPLDDALAEWDGGALPLSLIDRLAEAKALAVVRDSCAVVDWCIGHVQPVIDAGRALAELLRRAERRLPDELATTRWMAYETLCPGCGGDRVAGRAVAPGDADCFAADRDCDEGAALAALTPVLPWLRRDPSRPPRRPRDTAAATADQFRPDSDAHPKLLIAADRRLAPNLHHAWTNQQLTAPAELAGLQVLRTKATVAARPSGRPVGEVWLDTVYDQILAGSWVVVTLVDQSRVLGETVRTEAHRVVDVVQGVRQESVPGNAAAKVSIPCTVLTVAGSEPWGQGHQGPAVGTAVWAQGETLTPQGDPITGDIAGAEVELAQVYPGLQPGRLLVVAGERTDVPHTSGVRAAEVTLLAGVRQRMNPDRPGSALRTVLELSGELAYRYRRDTVTVYGNVAEANQGETRREVLGAGDATVAGQRFPVRQISPATPLTALPADNPAGFDDTLSVSVNGVRWRATESLAMHAATDRVYATDVAVDNSLTVRFGDGERGARPATGVENVTAAFRVGAGRSGNVAAEQIAQLASRPLGVNAVVNPVAAVGGTDGDGPDDMRATIPLRMFALDRLVSVRDYEDFTRARAGIAKAAARKLFDGQAEVVHVTVAAVGDAPLDPSARLIVGLEQALRAFGDIGVPVRVDARELVLLILRAGVAVLPDHSWDLVEPAVRAAVLNEFSFAASGLGEPAHLSRAIAAMQSVPGVDYVDIEVFQGVPDTVTPLELLNLAAGLTGVEHRVAAGPAEFQEVTVAVNDGESLTDFALRVGLTLSELAELNPGLADIEIGDRALTVFRGIRPARIAVLPGDVPEALTLRRIS